MFSSRNSCILRNLNFGELLMALDEVSALKAVDSAFKELDDEARLRILQWAWSKYGNMAKKNNLGVVQASPNVSLQNMPASVSDGEIPGIAKLTEDGELVLTVRDIKAANKKDAAIRLVHISIRAYQTLTGDSKVSSKGIVTPILKEWRTYDGNTRSVISKHKGIIRNGDFLSLDAHSKLEADQYIKEILDESIEGKWSPSKVATKRTRR